MKNSPLLSFFFFFMGKEVYHVDCLTGVSISSSRPRPFFVYDHVARDERPQQYHGRPDRRLPLVLGSRSRRKGSRSYDGPGDSYYAQSYPRPYPPSFTVGGFPRRRSEGTERAAYPH